MPRGRKKGQGDVLLKSAEMIGWAIGGIEREIVATRERLAALTTQATVLRAKLPAGASARGAAAAASAAVDDVKQAGRAVRAKARRRMSPEARKRISEMMKKRWAERKKSK